MQGAQQHVPLAVLFVDLELAASFSAGMAAHVLQVPPPPIAQTLAQFGGSAQLKGSAADALGNVYLVLLINQREVLVKHSSKDNSLTELQLEVDPYDDIMDIAASPDGEELYLLSNDGGVAVYRSPWGAPWDKLHPDVHGILGLDCYKRG
jgi:hypothetical protein